MNQKKFIPTLSLCALAFLCCCAKHVTAQVVGAPSASAVPNLVNLDAALADAALAIGVHAHGFAHIAVAGIEAPSRKVEGFIADELSAGLVKNKSFKVLERGAALSAVDNEHKFQMSGIVDDKEIVGVGHYLGADAVITGAFHCFAGFGQLRLRVIAVRDAQLLTMYTARVSLKDPVLAGILPPKDKRPNVSDAALAYLNRGMDLLREGKYDGAIRELDQALAINWNLPMACFYRGWAYSLLGEHDRAIADYNAALRLKPDYYEALNNRGAAYDDKGEYDKAIADYDTALAVRPNNHVALNNRGLAYRHRDKKGDNALAFADYDAALKIKPNYYEALYNRGYAHYDMRRYDQAIADYNAALKINPDFSLALRDRGLAYHKSKKLNAALEDYNAAIKLSPNDYQAFIYRGIVREQIDGSYRGCVADFNAALKIKPDNADALFYRGRTYYNMNDKESAISDFRALLRIDPDNRIAAQLLWECESQSNSSLLRR